MDPYIETIGIEQVPAEFERARQAFRMAAGTALVGTAEGNIGRFNRALAEFERAAWQRGFELGAGVAQRNAEDIIAQAALAVLGKDRADGEVDLGALGKRYAV